MTEDERIELARELLEQDVDTPEGFYWDENGDLQEFPEAGPDYRYVLGLDPGGTTGVAMIRYTDESQPELIYLQQIEGGKEGFKDWFYDSSLGEDLDVASEVWEEHNVKGADRTPLVLQGLMYGLWGEPENFHYQSPKLKSLVPDEWLREQNLWTPNRRHQMDALIHALVFLRNNGHRPTQKALTGDSKKKLANRGEAESKEVSEAANQTAEAFKKFSEEVEKARKAMEKLAEEVGEGGDGESAESEDDGQPAGEGESAGMEIGDDAGNGQPAGDYAGNIGREGDIPAEWLEVEVKGERKRRERNGVFAGFETDEEDEEVLFSD